MELLETSLDRFYKYVYHRLQQCIPEMILALITRAVRDLIVKGDPSRFCLDIGGIGLYQISLEYHSSRCETFEYSRLSIDGETV